jgi:hypothetical protein
MWYPDAKNSKEEEDHWIPSGCSRALEKTFAGAHGKQWPSAPPTFAPQFCSSGLPFEGLETAWI